MRRLLSLPLVLGLAALSLSLAGCSGSGGSRARDAAAIRSVLAGSTLSLFHYRNPAWWGRDPRLTLEIHVARGGRYARAVATAEPWRGRRARQLVLLGRQRDGWRILDTGARDVGLRCAAAPAAVMRELFGGCARLDVFDGPLLEGPRAARPASPAEHRALAAFERQNLFGGHDRCVTYLTTISRVDDRWGEVAYELHQPYVNCRLGNGVSLVTRRRGRWREVSEASEGFECDDAPTGVVRSLDGSCWLPTRGGRVR